MRSVTVRSNWPPICSGVSDRTLVRSGRRPVGTQAPDQLPVPDVHGCDARRTRSNNTSVKPPVDAPASRQRRPATVSPAGSKASRHRSACARHARPLLLLGFDDDGYVLTDVGRRFHRRSAVDRDRPAAINSPACSRERARPRRTSSASRRARVPSLRRGRSRRARRRKHPVGPLQQVGLPVEGGQLLQLRPVIRRRPRRPVG